MSVLEMIRPGPVMDRISATVEAAGVTTGWYLVRDSAGRLRRVAGAGTWRVGQRVVVLGNQIVATAGAPPVAKTYQV